VIIVDELKNRALILNSRPNGFPDESSFKLIEFDIPEINIGEFIVKILWLSVDPYMRGRMSDKKSYAPSVEIGDVMVGGAVGKIISSRNLDFEVGDLVEGRFGWQEYAISNGSNARKLSINESDSSKALGVLGMPGLTAYFGLFYLGRPIPNQTVVISAASGAVGAVVGQLAKMTGCKVVGIVGSESKASYITEELNFDFAINYKKEDVCNKLLELCPNGIDIYFDNVGGQILEAVLENLAFRARIVVCGQIAQYNLHNDEVAYGITNFRNILTNQATVEGFIVNRFSSDFPQAFTYLEKLFVEGNLKSKEDIVLELENTPDALLRVLTGKNFGKQIVKIALER
jgi:NADPH-dependent curcumin reductase CurA|tara:strand:- start:1562 stop:2593 length:1032 start_codon:yes stop_codon:yes gene_type:complete